MPERSVSARSRLFAAFALAFGIASVQSLALLPVVAGLAMAGVILSGQARRVMRSLRAPAMLAFGILLVLPLLGTGTPLLQLGPAIWHHDGAIAAVLIVTRLLGIVTLTLALLGPVSPFALVGAMRSLGIPALMADLALLTLRYLDDMRGEIARAMLARRLRGGRGGWGALPDHARVLAACLIRAQMRAERVWAAMRLRGYSTGLATPAPTLHMGDVTLMTSAGIAALALVMLGWLA
jgi:cobalt/nickel transport system permease protein